MGCTPDNPCPAHPECEDDDARQWGRNDWRNVIITGEPEIGINVSIGDYSEINAKGANVVIGDGCDIASFVAINAADSSDKCIGKSDQIRRRNITIGDYVFIGSHCFIGGGVRIGHHSKIAAGTIIVAKRREVVEIPPYSLVWGNPWFRKALI